MLINKLMVCNEIEIISLICFKIDKSMDLRHYTRGRRPKIQVFQFNY